MAALLRSGSLTALLHKSLWCALFYSSSGQPALCPPAAAIATDSMLNDRGGRHLGDWAYDLPLSHTKAGQLNLILPAAATATGSMLSDMYGPTMATMWAIGLLASGLVATICLT